jgi:hypothetical protein
MPVMRLLVRTSLYLCVPFMLLITLVVGLSGGLTPTRFVRLDRYLDGRYTPWMMFENGEAFPLLLDNLNPSVSAGENSLAWVTTDNRLILWENGQQVVLDDRANATREILDWSADAQFTWQQIEKTPTGSRQRVYLWNGSAKILLTDNSPEVRDNQWLDNNRFWWIESEGATGFGRLLQWDGQAVTVLTDALPFTQDAHFLPCGAVWSHDRHLGGLFSIWTDTVHQFVLATDQQVQTVMSDDCQTFFLAAPSPTSLSDPNSPPDYFLWDGQTMVKLPFEASNLFRGDTIFGVAQRGNPYVDRTLHLWQNGRSQHSIILPLDPMEMPVPIITAYPMMDDYVLVTVVYRTGAGDLYQWNLRENTLQLVSGSIGFIPFPLWESGPVILGSEQALSVMWCGGPDQSLYNWNVHTETTTSFLQTDGCKGSLMSDGSLLGVMRTFDALGEFSTSVYRWDNQHFQQFAVPWSEQVPFVVSDWIPWE